jgi:hypothetical protein
VAGSVEADRPNCACAGGNRQPSSEGKDPGATLEHPVAAPSDLRPSANPAEQVEAEENLPALTARMEAAEGKILA